MEPAGLLQLCRLLLQHRHQDRQQPDRRRSGVSSTWQSIGGQSKDEAIRETRQFRRRAIESHARRRPPRCPGRLDDPAGQSLLRPLAGQSLLEAFPRAGIVEPEDDIRDTNPPTNPELLDALASHFSGTGYDLKDLVRTICKSQTYQLDSIPNGVNEIDKQNYSRYYPKRLQAEVLLDSVNSLTAPNPLRRPARRTRAIQLPDNFFNNSSLLPDRLRPPRFLQLVRMRTLRRSQPGPIASPAESTGNPGHADGGRRPRHQTCRRQNPRRRGKIRQLYHIAFSRDPEPSEMAASKGYIEQLQAKADKKDDKAAVQKRAYEDLIWALINTKEFSFNH